MMSEVKAGELRVGDLVRVRGVEFTVTAACLDGKRMHLTLSTGVGEFRRDYPGVAKAKDRLELLQRASVDVPWVEASSLDEPIVQVLGARLVAVEVEGGRLLVPPVDDSTILGHLATMHGVRWDGVSVKDAKAWVKLHPGSEKSLDEVLSALDVSMAFELHDRLHQDLAGMPRPHWHREKVPA